MVLHDSFPFLPLFLFLYTYEMLRTFPDEKNKINGSTFMPFSDPDMLLRLVVALSVVRVVVCHGLNDAKESIKYRCFTIYSLKMSN